MYSDFLKWKHNWTKRRKKNDEKAVDDLDGSRHRLFHYYRLSILYCITLCIHSRIDNKQRSKRTYIPISEYSVVVVVSFPLLAV